MYLIEFEAPLSMADFVDRLYYLSTAWCGPRIVSWFSWNDCHSISDLGGIQIRQEHLERSQQEVAWTLINILMVVLLLMKKKIS